MKTIVLFIRNANLKMNVIRTLMKNEFYYIEAANTEELIIKLDLSKDASLLIMDYSKEEQETDLTALVQANLQQLPILWIMPDEDMFQLSGEIKQYLTDIILTPFNEQTMLRKINAIISIQENRARTRIKATRDTKLSASQSDKVMTAMESAIRGRYPICFIRLNIADAFMELNLHLLDKLKATLRQSDQIIEIDLGEFLILCPYTPLQSLKVVETKILDAIYPIVRDAISNPDVQIYGTSYPDEIKSYYELISNLANEVS
ncbi:MAG: hypothetical protein ACOYEH_09680 [Caldicoprobacterales bacterium]|jgi:response regulator RpfG family c-di-GMP phosphodiesterase|nr:hypothetical protein [Clostridiales bacterium]